jgi:16S rRNA (guanine1207-N2)-methyltransferase
MAHYYDANPKGKYAKIKISATLRGREFNILSAGGIFSVKHVDNATELLIESAKIEEKQRVLDLGCGYGIIGIAIKTFFPDCDVVMTDVNKRATHIARQNVKSSGLDIKVLTGDCYTAIGDETFDVILTNPPYSAGRSICFTFIDEAFRRLNAGGTLQLVARHSKGGKVLSKRMEEVFGSVEATAKKGGFRVYLSKKE